MPCMASLVHQAHRVSMHSHLYGDCKCQARMLNKAKIVESKWEGGAKQIKSDHHNSCRLSQGHAKRFSMQPSSLDQVGSHTRLAAGLHPGKVYHQNQACHQMVNFNYTGAEQPLKVPV